MNSKVSRRGFLGASAAALTAASYARAAKANERLSVGIVGPGGRGRGLLRNFFDVNKDAKAELTALCDIWSVARERGNDFVKKAGAPEPRQLKRLDDMLALKDLDAVIIGTSDHAHAQQIVQTLAAGKHIYCEKPFANVLEEANAAIDACRKSDKVVTLGTQRRSDPHYLAAVDVVKTIGDVVQVEMIQNAYSPYRWRREADVKAMKESDTDWKAFLMGRSDRPFDPRQYLEFRLFRDFSSGIIDQWMTHMIDAVHMLTGATHPKSVVAHGGNYAWKDYRENGDTVHVALDYGTFMTTYSSTLANGFGSACRVMGKQGTLEFENVWQVSPLATKKGEKQPEGKPIAAKEGLQGNMDQIHMRNWLECVHKGQRQTHCTAEHGYQHSIACILATQALRTGKRLVFDEKARTIREG